MDKKKTANNNLPDPQFLKEGSYGCVHRPPLQCKAPHPPNTPDQITKLMSKTDADTELKEYSLISTADPENDFSLKPPTACKIARSQRNLNAITPCSNKTKVMNALDNYRLLVMKNGGEDLDVYGSKMQKLSPTPETRERVQYMWMEIHHMMMAIRTLLEHKIVHHDIKRDNILYCEKTRRMYLIDFGIMEVKAKSIGQCETSNYHLDTPWWYYPFEGYFLNKRTFNRVILGELRGSDDDDSEFLIREFVEENFVQDYQKDEEYAENWLYFLKKFTQLTEEELVSLISDFTDFIVDVQTKQINYETFLNQYFDTLDAYSLAVACIELLHKTKAHVPEDFYHQSRALFLQMMSFDPMKRPNIGTIVSSYENILESTGMLQVGGKKMVFKNHVLTPVTATAAAAAATPPKPSPQPTVHEVKTVSEMVPPSSKQKTATPRQEPPASKPKEPDNNPKTATPQKPPASKPKEPSSKPKEPDNKPTSATRKQKYMTRRQMIITCRKQSSTAVPRQTRKTHDTSPKSV